MNLISGTVKNNIFICNNSNTYTYKKNTYKIAYDGNIYNSVIIKQELLSKGYYFETNFEDEIILKSFIEFGFDTYSKFSGHFSIVIWNENKSELIFMKDYYSVKSLYYKLLDNGDIVFLNNLVELLNTEDNVISYDRFIDSYIEKINIRDGFITETIKESDNIMIYTNKVINQVKNINCSEYAYLFDEVAQVALSNLEEINIVKLEHKNSEISVIAEYILDMLDKEKVVVAKQYSKKSLNSFLTNMSLPFFNLAEYNLSFTKVRGIGLIDLEANNIKRFYNIDFLCNEYDIKLVFPRFCHEKIFGINEVYLPVYELEQCDCKDEELVDKEFREISNLEKGNCDYYTKVYFIRLNNWLQKYNIKII